MASPAVFTVLLVLQLAAFAAGNITKDECQARVVLASVNELKEEMTLAMQEVGGFKNATINNIPTGLGTQQIVAQIAEKLDAVNRSIEQRFNAVDRKLDSLERRVNKLHGLGLTSCHAASSCSEILQTNPASSSNYYWITNSTGHPHSVYCDMTRSCGGVTGAWMRVAYLDMTNRQHHCPSGLRQRTDSGVRSCAAVSDAGPTCSSAIYDSHGIPYSRVCGKITAYQDYSMDGFYSYSPERRNTIDSNYVDGVSLTHGTPHRHHIWTFVAGPCPERAAYPPFLNNEFFHDDHRTRSINLGNPLWDGESCTNTCCHHNNPPWFHKELPRQTTDNVEMRVCRDQDRGDEDLGIKEVEIYVN